MSTQSVSKMFLPASLMLCSFTMTALPPVSQKNQTRMNKDQDAVQACVSQALQKAELGDISSFKSHLTPDFYLFERGIRYDTQGLVKILQRAQTSGSHMHWSVTQADVHVNGQSAWIAYVNDGSVSVDGHSVHRQWLESAFLEKSSGHWKISFWHSTPVPSATDTGGAPTAKE